ncbi:MAG: hypothetical protein JW776_07270 [Candidatus Lokiarchaeota archaeon]|nr:hypothetical protein [Candidatus Lokiarchaeota archaeon]
MTLKHLWIIDDLSSTAVFYKNYSAMDIDQDLVSGLLSALHNFSEVELKQHGIESINMGGLSFSYVDSKSYNLLLIAADDKDADPKTMKFRLERIFDAFIQRYELTPEKWREIWNGNVSKFIDFYEITDEYISQWKQAEEVLSSAALIDLMGVAQQILNLFTNVIKNVFTSRKEREIHFQILKGISKILKDPEYQKDSEIQKITFAQDFEWNIISINPTKVNGELLNRFLLKIINEIKVIFLKYFNVPMYYEQMSQEIFPYLISSWSLLRKLDIDKKLMTILLSTKISN